MNAVTSPEQGAIFDSTTVRPDLMSVVQNFFAELKTARRLPDRLVELIRLRIAFHNQCRLCMSIRYGDAVDAGVTEELVCSLERPAEAPDMTAAEKAALAYADRFATNHLSIDAARIAELGRHFNEGEIAEITLLCGVFIGLGRMRAVLDPGEEQPVGARRTDGKPLTPWGITPTVVRT